MKQLFDFIPVLVFVVVYYLTDIFVATAALMIAVTAQVAALWITRRPVPKQLKITLWLSLALGALTLLYQDRAFIQWKPTVVNWVLAAVLIGSQFVGQRTILERLLGHQLSLPARVWTRLNLGWAAGFAFAGALNLVVAYTMSEAFWVNYKLIGGLGLTLLYIVLTFVYLQRGGHLHAAHELAKSESTEKSP